MAERKVTQKEKIIRATAELLRRRGYSATVLSDIVEKSRAPKGSVYYYFPGGKDEIAAAAVRYAGDRVKQTLQELAATTTSPAALLRSYGNLVAGWMTKSGFRDGCPITTVLLETAPEKGEIAAAGREVFSNWFEIVQRRLIESGLDEERAQRLSRLAIMALEGALLLARVEQSSEPILLAMDEMAVLFERECSR
jgi:TetR/AcrR family transcriptional repressor of lmrAB and yxaGH operons